MNAKRKYKVMTVNGELRSYDDPRFVITISVNGTVIDTDKLNNQQYARALEMGLLYLTNMGEIDLNAIRHEASTKAERLTKT